LALLLRERKPVGALAGVLAAYLAFDLDPLLLPGVLFALLTVATIRHRHTLILAATATAAVIAAIRAGPRCMPMARSQPVTRATHHIRPRPSQ
jgi:hypothetical protein